MRLLTYALWTALHIVPLIHAAILSHAQQELLYRVPEVEKKVIGNELRGRIDSLRKKWGVQGITIGLAASPGFMAHRYGVEDKKEWVLETASFGTANRYGDPVDENTLFGIASNSKLFTALSVGLLIENTTTIPNGDTLKWSTRIKDILPEEWKLMDDYASNHATLLDLLSMQSGLPRHDSAKGPVEIKSVVASMRHLKPSAELRQAWQYNNMHYLTLAYIVETLSAISFPYFVQTHVLDPVGLSSTFYNATAATATGHRSDGYSRIGKNATECIRRKENASARWDKSCIGEPVSFGWWTGLDGIFEAGAGGVIMPAKDMAKWVKELLSPNSIPADLIQKTTTTLAVVSGEADPYPELGLQTYGLGQWVYTYRGYTIHSHTGSVPGQMSFMIRLPHQGFGFMIAINDDDLGSKMHKVIAYMIVDELLELDPISWETRLLEEQQQNPEHTPSSRSPRAMPENVAGKYSNGGYGVLDLVEAKPSQASFFLEELDGIALNLTGPVFFACINKTFSSHLILTPFDGVLFNWTEIRSADRLSADDEVLGKIVTVHGSGTAVVAEKGIGMFGDMWGKGTSVEGSILKEEGVEAVAEIWFTKAE